MFTKSLALLLLFCLIFAVSAAFGSKVICNEKDREALLNFKKGVTIDDEGRLRSWSVLEDCCMWAGVHCDNITGRVVKLDLQNPYLKSYQNFRSVHQKYESAYDSYVMGQLGEEINPWLLQLEHLSYLDLSGNYFIRTSIPYILSSVDGDERYHHGINFSFILFPHPHGDFSNLYHLDLSCNYYLHIDDLSWVSRISSLEYLNLNYINLGKESLWVQHLANLPSLSELNLRACQLVNTNPSLSYLNLSSSLTVLDLSQNYFGNFWPSWLFNLSDSLSELYLNMNHLKGPIPNAILDLRKLKRLLLCENELTGLIPEWLGQFENLEILSLSQSSFSGPIPESLGNLSSLTLLDISSNQLNNTIPEALWQLSELQGLDVGSNPLLVGEISDLELAKLTKLQALDLASPLLSFSINQVSCFQLQTLLLSSCKVGPSFPAWLQTQKSLKYLDVSRSGISDMVPDWFWTMADGMMFVNLSGNAMSGDLSNVMLSSYHIDLSSNNFKGLLPLISPYVMYLNVAKNSLSGRLDPLVCPLMNGSSSLQFLDVSGNLLSGDIPNCWMWWPYLISVNLGSNYLSGRIPNSMGALTQLQSLQLNNNSLSGGIPSSLQKCSFLRLLNLRKNDFLGTLPRWIGDMKNLEALLFTSNNFSGDIPPLCKLSSLMVLDFANNSFSGPIPPCLGHLKAMTRTDPLSLSNYDYVFGYRYYSVNLELVAKGLLLEYRSNFNLLKSIDISDNNLSGDIPANITRLSGLIFLNLSRNHLVGQLPNNIGSLYSVESLDLSRNLLSGEIPLGISNLTFLSSLNLSYNDFSGTIPQTTQLLSLDADSFIGNPKLCGPPLKKTCGSDNNRDEQHGSKHTYKEQEDGFEMPCFYMGIALGFPVGFWTVCCLLFFKKSWRHAYFQFVDDMKDKIYVGVVLNLKWLHNKTQNRPIAV